MNNPTLTTLSKDEFPELLKQLVEKLKLENLTSGFKACGIFPFDPEQVLKTFPEGSDVLKLNVFDAVLDHLQKMREGEKKPKQRRKKVQVEAGKSVTSDLEGNVAAVITVPIKTVGAAAAQVAIDAAGWSDDSDNDVAQSEEEEEVADTSEDELLGSYSEENEEPFENVQPTVNLQISDCVQVLKDPFKGYYAQITGNSYGDEFEIQYFKFKCGYHVVSVGDLDSRPPEELKKVGWRMDRREHYFFEKL